MSFQYYIWYRVERDDAETERAVLGMMARLACRSGIQGRLMKKRAEPGLWMEVYEGVVDVAAFDLGLKQMVDQYDLGMFIDGNRHAECFAECATPAAAYGCRGSLTSEE